MGNDGKNENESVSENDSHLMVWDGQDGRAEDGCNIVHGMECGMKDSAVI
jgi:hypothetical protein